MSDIISLSDWQKKRADSLASRKSQSPPITASDELGQIPTDEDDLQALFNIYAVIKRARISPFTTKSEFARVAATEVAICAVEGLISNRLDEGLFTNVWMVTAAGLEYMEEAEHVLGIRH